MPEITTYTADVSICSQICRLAVQEHHLDHAEDVHVDIEHAMDNYEPWFVRIQPSMTVPVMKYGDEYVGIAASYLLAHLRAEHEDIHLADFAFRNLDQHTDDQFKLSPFSAMLTLSASVISSPTRDQPPLCSLTL